VSGRAIAAGDAKLMVLGMGLALDWWPHEGRRRAL